MVYEYDVVGNLNRHDFSTPYKLSGGESEIVIKAIDEYIKTHPTELNMTPFLIDLQNFGKWGFKGFDLDYSHAQMTITAVRWYESIKTEQEK